MKKSEAINLLNSEGWTKKDAERALVDIDFDNNPDELTIRKAASSFADKELLNRQRLQAAQKTLVTKKNKEIEQYKEKISKGKTSISPDYSNSNINKLLTATNQLNNINQELKQDNERLKNTVNTDSSEIEIKKLLADNNALRKINQELKQDNKRLKNIVDLIKLKLAQSTNDILRYEDSEIRKAVIKLLHSTLG